MAEREAAKVCVSLHSADKRGVGRSVPSSLSKSSQAKQTGAWTPTAQGKMERRQEEKQPSEGPRSALGPSQAAGQIVRQRAAGTRRGDDSVSAPARFATLRSAAARTVWPHYRQSGARSAKTKRHR